MRIRHSQHSEATLLVIFIILAVVATVSEGTRSLKQIARHPNSHAYPVRSRRDGEGLTFKIAALLPDLSKSQLNNWQFSIQYIKPAITLALQRVRDLGILAGANSITVQYADSQCDNGVSLNEAINFYMNKSVDVYFGPCCDYSVAPIARQVRYWNIPLLTAGAMARDFGIEKHRLYSTLTRFGPTFDSVADMFLSILRYYSWKNVKLIYDAEGQNTTVQRCCHLVIDGFYNAMLENPDIREDHKKIENLTELDLAKEISTSKFHFAIIVLCASPDSVRDIMIAAAKQNFDNGDYVFFSVDLFSSKSTLERPWYRKKDPPERNELAKKGFRTLKIITLRKPDSAEYQAFSEKVRNNTEGSYQEDEEVNSFVGAFHDAVILYSLAVNETLAARMDPTNGTEITRRMWNRTFDGITGKVTIDENGDRSADYSLLDMNDNGTFEVVANYLGSRKVYELLPNKIIHWPGNRTEPPPDTPACGFDGSLCPPDEPFPVYGIVIIVLGSMLVIVSVSAFIIWRYRDTEDKATNEKYWRVVWNGNRKSSVDSNTTLLDPSGIADKQPFTSTRYYPPTNNMVALKRIRGPVNISRPLQLEFKIMRELQSEHIARFIGVCIDKPPCIVTEYCVRGSLRDVLKNEQIKLDGMFKFSLIQDIIMGMTYLHSSYLHSHGNLKSSNCLVDSRFVLKITDFGIHSLRNKNETAGVPDHKALLWTAPELLRGILDNHYYPPEGTQKGDVYSFSIICQEIIEQRGPFWIENRNFTAEEICLCVKSGRRPLTRPTLRYDPNNGDEVLTEEIYNQIVKCWSEEPDIRPDFHFLKAFIKRISRNSAGGGNLIENLLTRMEQYANNLEQLVEKRTADWMMEKQTAEDLLFAMLPKSVALRRMHNEPVEPERYDSVTIYFSDIVSFTTLTETSTPLEVVNLLNDLYTLFDTTIDKFDVYKVETIGDAYMVASGVPIGNGIKHAREIARMALSLLHAIKSFTIRHRPGEPILLRIGIHSGNVCACMVGFKMPHYCLVGDTVNTASRMESNGEALKIHVSDPTKKLLDEFKTFELVSRGPVVLKGKYKPMDAWWLVGDSAMHEYIPPDEMADCDDVETKKNA